MNGRVAGESVFILALHRGGSTFLTDSFGPMLADDLGLSHVAVEQLLLTTGDHIAHAGEFVYQDRGCLYTRFYPLEAEHLDLTGRRVIAVERDPRDIAVSWYYSVRYSHGDMPGVAGDALRRDRLLLSNLSLLDGIKTKTAPMTAYEFRRFRAIVTRYPNILLTRYEEMVTDFPSWFGRVAAYLDLGGDRARYHALAGEFIVESEDVTRHKRRVRPGNWKEVFDQELREYFERGCFAV